MSLDTSAQPAAAALHAPDGEAAAAREARRMARLAALERLRDRAERISETLCNLVEGTLSPEARQPLAHIADPALAFTRVATAIRRIAALEEQIDEDAEARAERLAEEAAKRAKEIAAAQAAQVPADRRIHLRASRRIGREAVRAAILDRTDSMGRGDREDLLNDLTSDLDFPDYADNFDLIVAQIGKDLDAIIGPPIAGGKVDAADENRTPARTPVPALSIAPPANAPARPPSTGSTADVYAALKRATDSLDRARARQESG